MLNAIMLHPILQDIVNHLLLVPNIYLPSLNQYLYPLLPRTIHQWNGLCIPNLSNIHFETFKHLASPTL